MNIYDLTRKFSTTRVDQTKAIFSTLFIAENKLQTFFDKSVPDLTLKQFMLLTLVRQAETPLTFTQSGRLLGCSRQNVKKLASALEKKGFVTMAPSEHDVRAAAILATPKLENYFQTVFTRYIENLHLLFKDYSDTEIEQLFGLLMKLYPAIDNLEHLDNKEHTKGELL